MRAPGFWWQPPGLAASLLAPVAGLYGAVAARRLRQPGTRAAVPVICVGNVTVGGTGKTPAVLAIASRLRALGLRPVVLTRGHGGRSRGPLLLDGHGFPEVGDEAVLLARAGPTVVARDRAAGAARAVEAGANVIVMDDGLQNPGLAKDLCLAVFDGPVGIGNGCVVPAGPLRAALEAQRGLIDAALVVGEGEAGQRAARSAMAAGRPILRAALQPGGDDAARRFGGGTRVLAFAGIGRPAKFFETLQGLGATIVEMRSFPDHHPYGAQEVSRLLDEASRLGAVPVTTEKDAVRLQPLVSVEGRVARIETVAVEMAFADEDELRRLLLDALGGISPADGTADGRDG